MKPIKQMMINDLKRDVRKAIKTAFMDGYAIARSGDDVESSTAETIYKELDIESDLDINDIFERHAEIIKSIK